MESSSPFVQHHEFFDVLLQPFQPLNNPKTMSKRQMQEEKLGEEERVVAKSKPMMSFSVEGCQSISDSTGFECISQPGDTQRTQFEFGPHQYGETRCKHSIEFSSVAFGCEHDHQYGETVAETTKKTIGTKPSHHNIEISRNNVYHLEKVFSNVRRKLSRPQGDDMLDIDIYAMMW